MDSQHALAVDFLGAGGGEGREEEGGDDPHGSCSLNEMNKQWICKMNLLKSQE